MLNQNNHHSAVASDSFDFASQGLSGRLSSSMHLDKKTRERLAAQRKMAARRAIERHYEKLELELHAKEYWFDG